MSQVSMCEAPPPNQIMMVDFAVRRRVPGPFSALYAAAFARFRPKKPRPPATRNVRRSMG